METTLVQSLVAEATTNARFYEYSSAADPISSGATPKISYAAFPSSLYAARKTAIIPLDLSDALKCAGPATTPSLFASYIKVVAGEEIATTSNATSELYYVLGGSGHTETDDKSLAWSQGDFFTLPGGDARHFADKDAVLYCVNDEPLLRYLGVRADTKRFEPTLWGHEEAARQLDEAARHPDAAKRSRVSVLLANKKFEQTMTITHVLWAMYGLIEPGTRQKPHRHQSVAVDLIIDAKPGCYTLVGTELDDDGNILNPVRADWESGAAFVTPPGYWHEHRNESGERAYLLPVQDAGLHTQLRTLDIRFWHDDD